MNKEKLIHFFDNCAPNWDAEMIRNESVITCILDDAQISEGVTVLDVACGTGVLFPDYIKRNVASVMGVDISPNMVKIAQNKFEQDNIKVVCADIESFDETERFDRIMVYNAFPHFEDSKKLIEKLINLANPGGIITIAHGMSREWINRHHEGRASEVSNVLISADEVAELFGNSCKVLVKMSSEDRYQVSAQKL